MFKTFLELGTHHILDINGLDHILFLLMLVIIYHASEWKKVILLATAFTIGHSITLSLATFDIVSMESRIVELLVAASIAWTALLNLFLKEGASKKMHYYTAVGFGLIHGIAFANELSVIIGNDSLFTPLLAFNLGVEIAQLIIVVFILIFTYLLVDLLGLKKSWIVKSASLGTLLYAIKLIIERL